MSNQSCVHHINIVATQETIAVVDNERIVRICVLIKTKTEKVKIVTINNNNYQVKVFLSVFLTLWLTAKCYFRINNSSAASYYSSYIDHYGIITRDNYGYYQSYQMKTDK
jgi:hypothetical protein